MKYQLVLQWPTSWLLGYNKLIEMEEALIERLGKLGHVDGHDMGSGEMNIFIDTDDPRATFDKTLSVLKGQRALRKLRAGYRDFNDDEYTPIYPEGLKRFSVI